MTVNEFIESLSLREEEHISIAQNLEDAVDAGEGHPEGCAWTPKLVSVNGRLFVICGTPETL